MLERLFRLKENGTTVRTEIVAGITSFMTVAYILAVNPQLLSLAEVPGAESLGIPKGGVFVATALAAFVGTVLMALFANYPFILAPGMGLNAFFAFTVVLKMGYSWQFALLTIFVEGLIFLALSLTPVREGIFNAIPMSLKRALAAGIGLFICFVALQSAHVVVGNGNTLVEMIKFNDSNFHTYGISALLALVGTLFTGFLLTRKVKGAILLGILATWIAGMICQATGIYTVDFASRCFSTYPELAWDKISGQFCAFGETFGALFKPSCWTHTAGGAVVGAGWDLVKSLDFFIVMFTFFFFDLFDTLGTLLGVSLKGGFLDKEGRLPRISGALYADSIATSVGAMLGTSTTTTFVESASGVMVGGRTGLTAMTAAVLFLASLVFAPIFLAIPAFATAPALIIVGYMMLSSCADVDWKDPCEAIPSFLAVVAMPFCYSISEGIMFGVIAYTAINTLASNFKRVHWIMYVLTVIFILKYALM